MLYAQPQQVRDCISKFSGIDDAQTLYCKLLNYDHQDRPIPIEEWSKSAKELITDGKIIAKKSGFYILYFTIRELTRTNERTVFKEILNKGFPDCAVVFSDGEKTEFHITSPRYEPESRYKFVIRRYVVGKHEQLRTASERLCKTYALDTDTATELKAKHDDAFNVEVVTKEFYKEYKEVLKEIEKNLLAQGIGDKKTAKGFAQQFLNKLMFLYFIQRKGWLNNDMRFVWNLVKRYKNTKGTPNGIYKDWLEPLFFYSLNKKPIPDSYKYLPPDLKKIYDNMPYLNGGLFVKDKELDEMGYQLDDALIYKLVDVDGGLLESYNFTIREDAPFDVDVAVDPEMLGKVYESLIHKEEREQRREAGIFYTPRIEVDFMCRQSILEYLVETTGISHDKLISFLYSTEEDKADLLSVEEAEKIRTALSTVKIVDPACGSGTFLVGMLHVLMELYSRILKKLNKRLNIFEFEIKKEIISNNLYGVDIKDWAVRVAELRLWLTLLVETEESEIKLDSGKPLLPNLRLKLCCDDSLVQEIAGKPLSARALMTHFDHIPKTRVKELYKELYEDKKNYYYSRPDAPNVLEEIKRKEVKIIKTLVDSEIKRIDLNLRLLAATQQNFGPARTAITASDKGRAEERIKFEKEKERLEELWNTLESPTLEKRPFVWEIDFAEAFADGGFDIVIANPPYVRQEKIAPLDRPEEEITTEVKKAYKEALVRSVIAQWGDEYKKDLKSDVYVYFYYHGLSVLKPGGVFCFISSNSWLDVGFGAKLQEFLLKNIEVKAIYDNHAKRSFQEASINTIIALFKRPADGTNLWGNRTKFVAFKKPFEEIITTANLQTLANAKEKVKTDDFRCIPMTQGELWKEGIEGEETKQSEITGSAFIGNYLGNKWGGKYLRAPDIFFTILEKGKGKLVRLGDIAEVRFGIKTGANEFFYLDEEAQKKWQIEEEYLKPVIKSPRECNSIIINPKDLKYKVFMCHNSRSELKETNALRYIEWGEDNNFHKAPTVQGRKFWWSLMEPEYSDYLWTMTYRERFFVLVNGIVLADARFYDIYSKVRNKTSLGLVLNSTLTLFYIELMSRTYGGGGGPVDVKVYEVEQMIIFNPNLLKKPEQNRILQREVNSIFEEIGINPLKPIREQEPNPLPDRAELDNIIFDELGLTEEERKEVYWSVCELVKQRLEKARSV
jgi:type I restriction-modification system DNA methylase subunit